MIHAKQVRLKVGRHGVDVLSFDRDHTKHYGSVEQLPQWMQERVAVLKVAGNGSSINGVGEYLLEDVFWIDMPE